MRFASQGILDAELRKAKAEYVDLTGELFESDPSFERRLASFLEWYTLDRGLSFEPNKKPVHLYLEQLAQEQGPETVAPCKDLAQTTLSLFEFKKAKGGFLHVIDLLTGEKLRITERRKVVGLDSGDIFEGRMIPYQDGVIFSDTFAFHPREASATLLKFTKQYRKQEIYPQGRIELVHRVAFFANRCERYKHVNPRQIFAQLGDAAYVAAHLAAT